MELVNDGERGTRVCAVEMVTVKFAFGLGTWECLQHLINILAMSHLSRRIKLPVCAIAVVVVLE